MVSFHGNNEQLRNALHHCAGRKSTGVTDRAVFSEAADRIEALEAENARLREALEWYGEQAAILAKATLDSEFAKQRLKRDMGGRARAALKQEGGE